MQTIVVHFVVTAILVGIPVMFALRYRDRHDGTTKGGAVVAAAGGVGILATAIALHYYDAWRDHQRMITGLSHLNDHICKSTGGGDKMDAMRELGCSENVMYAGLDAAKLSVDKHDALAGVTLPLSLPPDGTQYVVWFLDASGAPIAHLALPSGTAFEYVRDPKLRDAVGVKLTAETTVGTAPAAPVIASAPFVPL